MLVSIGREGGREWGREGGKEWGRGERWREKGTALASPFH